MTLTNLTQTHMDYQSQSLQVSRNNDSVLTHTDWACCSLCRVTVSMMMMAMLQPESHSSCPHISAHACPHPFIWQKHQPQVIYVSAAAHLPKTETNSERLKFTQLNFSFHCLSYNWLFGWIVRFGLIKPPCLLSPSVKVECKTLTFQLSEACSNTAESDCWFTDTSWLEESGCRLPHNSDV